jgi:hypothetical protein
MLGMFFTRVFDSKIVDHKEEHDWSCCVTPQAWGVDTFVISMWFEPLLQ